MQTRRLVLGAGAAALAALTASPVRPFARMGAALPAPDDSGGPPTGQPQPIAEVALFRDATEVLFSVAEHRRAADPTAPFVPRRYFVSNADEAHRIAFEGPNPIVGMSLDDLIACSRETHPDANQLVAFVGVHRGFLRLMAARDVSRIADLRGRRVAVDTDTGYASALFAMLARAGLERGRDFDVVYAGATNLRYAKLMAGEFAATLLGAPFTRLALRQGYPSLGTVIGALGGYQAVVLVAHRSWLADNKPMARNIVACLRETLDWASQADDRERVAAYVAEGLGGADHPTRVEVTQDLFGPASEFLPDGRMRESDMRVVLDLFNASRGTSLSQEAVSKLVDVSLLD